jgi:serine protease AprX
MTNGNEMLQDARRYVRASLGGDLEEKASDEFCIAVLSSQVAGPPAGAIAALEVLETVAPSFGPGPVATVLEFEHGTATGSATEAEAAGDPATRQTRIKAMRDSSYQVVGTVYDEIERLTGGLLRADREVVGAPRIPSLVTQVCWLNRTVRAWTDPHSLTEIAAHEGLERIDIPRRLLPDASINMVAIGAPAYRERTGISGDGLTVAVIDSEVAPAHPALAGRVVHRRNYTTEPWGNPGAHGTAVAGIIGADDIEHTGVAPRVTIYNYKVLATNRTANGDDFAGTIAVQQALEDGVDVANCSWGIGPADHGTSREARALDAAWALGLTIVKSAGNRGPGQTTITSPADAEGVIVVGATDLDGTVIEDYSSRGPTPDGRHRPHLVAPGGSRAKPMACCLVQGGFGDAGFGTSYAAPHASGAAALLVAKEALPPDEVRERLVSNCRPVPNFGPDEQGAGLLQLS